MKSPLPILAALFILSGCAQDTEKYYWQGYQESLLHYYRNPTAGPAYEHTLEKIVDRNRSGKPVPPGIYAEYGYMLFTRGDAVGAVQYFSLEKQHYPESAFFMDNAIRNAKDGKKIAVQNVPTTASPTPSSPASTSAPAASDLAP